MKTRTKKNETAFFTVVYPEADIYLDDFLSSLDQQTDKSFDLVIANDGLNSMAVYKDRFRHLNIIDFPVHGMPASIRSEGIDFILSRGYDTVIFGDADDYFDSRRIEINRQFLQDHDIVFNDLHLVDRSGTLISERYLSGRFHNGQLIGAEELKDKNFIGLSNSALHTTLLRDLKFPKDMTAFDWFLFSVLLGKGACCCFTNETATCYRQHPGNTIGLKGLDDSRLLQSLETKRNHYRYMQDYAESYCTLAEQYTRLLERLTGNPEFKRAYIHSIQNRQIDHPLWWEQVCLMENTYENTVNGSV